VIIEESKNLDEMKVGELQGSLAAYEQRMNERNLEKSSDQALQAQLAKNKGGDKGKGGRLKANGRTKQLETLKTISTHENLQGLVDIILVTSNTLMNEMVFPTEGNIIDCIRYGDPKYETFDIRKGLHCAIEQQKVVKRVFGTLRLYVVANENLWKCEPLTWFPDAIWVRIEQFLASFIGNFGVL
jgi:hypothetical protein